MLATLDERKIMTTEQRVPRGELVLRTLAMPADTNANGDIFGGWIMSQMDMGGAILAKEIAQSRTVTVAVDAMTFLKPVEVGDIVCCHAECIKTGRTSLTIKIEIWVKKVSSGMIGKRQCVTEAIFTYVSIDDNGKSRPLPENQQNRKLNIHIN